MKRRDYHSPKLCTTSICSAQILVNSTESLPFNPNEGTDEALTRKSRGGQNIWEEW